MSLRQVPRVRGVSKEFRQESRRMIQDIFSERSNVHDDDDYRISLVQDSSSSIGDDEKQHPGATQADESDPTIRHYFEGEFGSTEANEVNQSDQGNRQTQQQRENNVVGWDGPNDPQNPQNWKKSKKYMITVFYASLTFCVTFSSSVFSSATAVTAKTFGVSDEVMTLGTSLFVLVIHHPRFYPLVHSTLTQEIGIRSRPNHVGSSLGTLRSEDSSVLRILPLRHFSNPRRCRSKCRNNYAISILGRTIWMFTSNDSRRDIGRLLGSCRQRVCARCLFGRDLYRTRGRTNCRRLSHPKLSGMEMDGLDHLDNDRFLWTTGMHHMLGILRTGAATA